MPQSRHDFIKFLLPFNGSGVVEFEGGACMEIRPGRSLLIPPGLTHKLTDAPGEPLSLFVFCYRERASEGILKLLSQPIALTNLDFHGVLWERIKEWRFVTAQANPAAPELLRSLGFWLVHSLQKEITTQDGPDKDEAAPVEERILRDLQNTFFMDETLDGACVRWGMCRRTFTRRFKKHAGRTWHELRQELRVEYACLLLKNPAAKINDVALECGYNELSSFYRSFCRIKGQSPGEWRKVRRVG